MTLQDALISPSDLAGLLTDDFIDVVDVRSREQFYESHVPGAVNMPELFTYLPFSTPDGLNDLHDVMRRLLSEAGLLPIRPIVVYEDSLETMYGASCRANELLRYLGHHETGILNGGIRAWKNEQLPLENKSEQRTASQYEIAPRMELMATVEDVEQALSDDTVTLLDTRDRDEWNGLSSSPYSINFAPRKGRLPSAVRIDWHEFLDLKLEHPTFKSTDEILEICKARGLTFDNDIIIYCFKGARASSAAFAMRRAGFKHLRIYFASWNEWSRDPDLPIDDRVLDDD